MRSATQTLRKRMRQMSMAILQLPQVTSTFSAPNLVL